MGKDVSAAIQVPAEVGTCSTCFFWEDGRGGEKRFVTKRKRKTCFEQGYKAGDRCESFHPTSMHPTCGSCKWFTAEWRGKSCQHEKRYGVSSDTPANFFCEQEYELSADKQAEIQLVADMPLNLNGQPVHTFDVAASTRHSLLINRGDHAVLIEPGKDPVKVQLSEGVPIVNQVGGAFTFLANGEEVSAAVVVEDTEDDLPGDGELDFAEAELGEEVEDDGPPGVEESESVSEPESTEDDGPPGSEESDDGEEDDGPPGANDDDEEEESDDGPPGSDDDDIDLDEEDDGPPGSDDDDDGPPGADDDEEESDEDDGPPGSDDDSDDEDAPASEEEEDSDESGSLGVDEKSLKAAVKTVTALVKEGVPKDRATKRVARRLANEHGLDTDDQTAAVAYLSRNA